MIVPCVKAPKFALPPVGAVAWPSNEVTKDEANEYNQILRCCIEDGYTLMTGRPRRSVKRASARHATATPVTARPSEGATMAITQTTTTPSSVGAPVVAGAAAAATTTTGTATATRSASASSSSSSSTTTAAAAVTTTKAHSPALMVKSAGAATSVSGHTVGVTSTASGRTSSHHHIATGKHVSAPSPTTRDPGSTNADVRHAKTVEGSHPDDAASHRSSPHASIAQPTNPSPHGSTTMRLASANTSAAGSASRFVGKHQSPSTTAKFSAARQPDARASHAGKTPLSASAKTKAKMKRNAVTGKKRSSGNKQMIKREPGF